MRSRKLVSLVLMVIGMMGMALPSVGVQAQSCVPRADWTGSRVIARGETLYRIGLAYGLTANQLAQGNCIVNVNRIFAGQTLRVPGSVTPPPVVTPVPQQPGTLTTWMTVANAPLYGLPDTSMPVNNLAQQQLTLNGRTRDNAWVSVRTAGGQTGWMPSYAVYLTADQFNLLTIMNPETGGVVGPQQKPPYVAVMNDIGVRLRQGPGTQHPYSRLLSRETVTVTGRSVDSAWLMVQTARGDGGWVYGYYVALDSTLVATLPILGTD